MRNSLLILGVGLCFCWATAKKVCLTGPHDPLLQPLVVPCTEQLKDQIHKEFSAARAYLSLGTHFAQDTVNRPGFSEFFFKAASEEREHGIKLMEYHLMRGGRMSDFSSHKLTERNWILPKVSWESGVDALSYALDLEKNVTKSIDNLAKKGCEPDLHFVDYLTTEYLDEQFKGMRDLAGKISTLTQMSDSPLGEFLFDKKLLKGEL